MNIEMQVVPARSAGEDDCSPDRKAHVKLPNAALVDPLWHGDGCTGLSGVYAVVNSIRLVVAHKHEFSARRTDDLLMAGLRFMDGRLSPSRALGCGLRLGVWRQLVEALTDHARSRYGMLVFTERVHDDRDSSGHEIWLAIEQALDRHRAVLLLMRGGRYTVVSGYTANSLLLFDSGGACWISRGLTGVPGDCRDARHVIYPSSFVALRA